MNIDDLHRLFPECSDFQIVRVPSGQKDVIRAVRDGQAVAIKIFRRISGDEDRVQRELAAVEKLRSEFVPRVFSSGQVTIDGEARYFMIEQFIDGRSYRAILQQANLQPLDNVLDIGPALLKACTDFEAVQLVHRDLKPENLIVDLAGKVWVIDFGLARHLDLSSVTPTGWGVGTLGYAPLEQLRLIKADITSRADLFAVGTILYEALHGQNPWREGMRDEHDLTRKMSNQELPQLTIAGDKDNLLSDFISWLVQRFPSRRPQSAAEALEAFESVSNAMRKPG